VGKEGDELGKTIRKDSNASNLPACKLYVCVPSFEAAAT